MPRLAPDGTRCKENRITFGTSERKLLALAIKEQQKNRTQKYISSFALPISVLGLATGIGVAGYFMAPSIIQDAKDKVNGFVQGVKNVAARSSGKNADDPVTGQKGGYATLLCVNGPAEGRVVVNQAGGFPIVGSILESINTILIKSGELIGENEWVPIYGNLNKKARFIDELTEGWLYLDVTTGGPML